MFKLVLIVMVALASVQAAALNFSVVGKGGETLFSQEGKVEAPSNVGVVTLFFLDENEIEYDGSELGIREMFDLTNDLEMVSKSEMKAWGWCFSIDGKSPETLTHETPVEKNDTTIQWYYAYAHYKDGEWIGQCVVDY